MSMASLWLPRFVAATAALLNYGASLRPVCIHGVLQLFLAKLRPAIVQLFESIVQFLNRLSRQL
jgi:hypothetical protein